MLRPLLLAPALACFIAVAGAEATPANKAALQRHYEQFLSKELNRCTTCHLPSSVKNPESLEEFPHNPFGDRLRVLGEELRAEGKPAGVAERVALIANEDSDGDGVENQDELLAGANPGDEKNAPAEEQLAALPGQRAAFEKFLASYRWQPFSRPGQPPPPQVRNAAWVRTPIDAFVATEHEQRGLTPRPEAPKLVLLRRVHLDLIGLSPTPEEQRAFLDDDSPDAYEKVVERLLADPRHGERWGRHWMDVWRYSDWAGWTDGKQVRDSQRHIWRWRDWIIESLNADKGYDRMVVEMLAGDELAPDDPQTLRATGFLARNYKMLSREQWLEDTVKHTAQAFLGITLGCAKCHDHLSDPISQEDYFRVRAVFEPHEVRMDRVPGELDREKDGLPRVYDVEKDSPTYFLIRGDERKPDKDRVIPPGVPRALCGDRLSPALAIAPVELPGEAAFPDRRDFVIKETIAASEAVLAKAREALAKAEAESPQRQELEQDVAVAEASHAALLAMLRTEDIAECSGKDSEEWKAAAKEAARLQRELAVHEARRAMLKAKAADETAKRRLAKAAEGEGESASKKAEKEAAETAKKLKEAEGALAKAEEKAAAELTTEFKPRDAAAFPQKSTGRRLAFARWIANADNPLTARVAVNHLWLRHFGAGLVTTPEDLGSSGARPSNPALLDWLASEFMARGWSMKAMHRLMVTSSAYRMASTPDEANARIDQDNVFLWRMPSRRMEAELVRDNLLYVSGELDATMGGPEIDHQQGLTSNRRSVYMRVAAEKEVEFLKLFDGPSVTDCYQRRPSVMPQQALALSNSELTAAKAGALAKQLAKDAGADDEEFLRHAFERVLARPPTEAEFQMCRDYLQAKAAPSNDAAAISHERARENLVSILFNHHEFVTIR